MKQVAVNEVEIALGIKLPDDYINIFSSQDEEYFPDEVSLIRDPKSIIESTMEYRNGFSGLPKWPSSYIYIGDEADACPYVLNTESGSIAKLDKGNIEKQPIHTFQNINEFIAYFEQPNDIHHGNEKFNLLFWLLEHPIIFVIVVFFIALPLVLFSISQLFKYILSLF